MHNAFAADPSQFDDMEKKMTLERFQSEVGGRFKGGFVIVWARVFTARKHPQHPGFDFSGADVTGNYQGGGPVLPAP